MIETVDPDIVIEEQSEDYVLYRDVKTDERWEVHGKCVRLGNCLIGAVIEGYGQIESHEDIQEAKKKLGRDRIDSEMDVPVRPGFRGCCPLKIVVLNGNNK